MGAVVSGFKCHSSITELITLLVLVWLQVRRHTWSLQTAAGIAVWEVWKGPHASHLLVLNANNVIAAVQQTAGAGEQTEQPHEKAEGLTEAGPLMIRSDSLDLFLN